MRLNWVQTREGTNHAEKNGELLCRATEFWRYPTREEIEANLTCRICFVKSIHELAKKHGMRITKMEVIEKDNGRLSADVDVTPLKGDTQ